MQNQWYWKHHGDLLGPFETEVLDELIRQNRVEDRDQIRLTTSSEWSPAVEVKKLFARQSESPNASETFVLLPQRSEQNSELEQSNVSYIGRFLNYAVSKVQLIFEDWLEFITEVKEKSRDVLSNNLGLLRVLANRTVLLILISIVLTGVLVVQFNTSSATRTHVILADLTEARDRLLSMQSSNAPDDERKEFQNWILPRLETELGSLIRESKRNSTGISPSFVSAFGFGGNSNTASARKATIQAIHALIKVINEQTEPDLESPSAQVFEKHVHIARDIIEGRYSLPTADQPTGASASQHDFSMNTLVGAMFVLDAMLIVLALWFSSHNKSTP